MQPPVFVNNIFTTSAGFEEKALQLFSYQYRHNNVYRQWCSILGVDEGQINTLTQIPFLPVSFFKTHAVVTGSFVPEVTFTSSGTTQTLNSHHYVKELDIYRQSFIKAFELFYGSLQNWCVIGLLPSYLERSGSSLVLMADEMIKLSNHPASGFYLYGFDKLAGTLQQLEKAAQPTLLLGVTFALLDFAASHPMPLHHTVIMETGGMKGRRRERTRQEVHTALCSAFKMQHIHSEYGMTELLSQAYSKGEGRFYCPPWMRMLVRNEEDPLSVATTGKGVLNIIDLANIYSCAFIAVDDAGFVYGDGSFEVWGRLDNSDIRGCSLMVV
ncbi:MAG TPA: hypothetical protein VHB48_19255 [Chitinophagaceae bacterium]|nr:hypothetical protein [Chitinophagaceae bacterium]